MRCRLCPHTGCTVMPSAQTLQCSHHLQQHRYVVHIVQTNGHSSCKAAVHAARSGPFAVCLRVQPACWTRLTQQEGQKQPQDDCSSADSVTQTASRDSHRRSKMTPCSTAGSTSMMSRIGHLRAGALSSIASASPGAQSMFHWGIGGSRLRRRVALRKASHQLPHSAGLAGRACKSKGGQEVAVKHECLHVGKHKCLHGGSTSDTAAVWPSGTSQARHVLLPLHGQAGGRPCWNSSPAPPHRDGVLCLRCTTPLRGPPGKAPPRRALPPPRLQPTE